jgi:hypothetical protein
MMPAAQGPAAISCSEQRGAVTLARFVPVANAFTASAATCFAQQSDIAERCCKACEVVPRLLGAGCQGEAPLRRQSGRHGVAVTRSSSAYTSASDAAVASLSGPMLLCYIPYIPLCSHTLKRVSLQALQPGPGLQLFVFDATLLADAISMVPQWIHSECNLQPVLVTAVNCCSYVCGDE